jgi:hypothetical protein
MEPLDAAPHILPYRAITFEEEPAVDDDGKPSLAPVVPIVVRGPRRALPLQGLIDSGADCSLFPYAIMATIGINLEDCVETDCMGAVGGGSQHVFADGIEIEIPDLGRRMHVEANFSQLPGSLALLGRLDFFKAFRVTVDERSETFSLQPFEDRSQ